MKKYLSLILAIFLVFIMAACQSDDTEPTDAPSTATPATEATTEPTEEPTTKPTEDPTTEPTLEPTTEPTEEPTTEPTAEPTTEPTEEPTTEPPGTTYILNTNSKKFHYPSCGSVETMKESNKDTFTGTREEVIALGYEPCGRCKP